MRWPLIFLIGCSVTLLSCATQPHKTVIRYSPPSVGPAKAIVSNAQGHAKGAKAAVVRAQKVAPKDIPALSEALSDASDEIDALTKELLNEQTALADLEKKTSGQTDALNSAIDDKNAAIDRNADIERKLKAIVHQRNKLFLLLCAALAWIFRTPLLWLAKFLLGVISKIGI